MGETNHSLNPAGRLFLAFEHLLMPKLKEVPFRDGLSAYFDVSDEPALLRHFAALCSLPSQTRDLVNFHDLPSEFLEDIPPFEQWFLTVNLRGNAKNGLAGINDTQMKSLKQTSALLARSSTETTLDDDAESSILELLGELDELLVDCVLPDPIPHILRDSAERMREALSMTIVLGTDPLLQEVYRSRGAVVSYYPVFKDNEDAAVIKKFGTLLNVVAAAITVVGFTNPQLEASELLGLLPGT